MKIEDAKVGDRVRVTDNDGAKWALSTTSEYEVTKIAHDCVHIRDLITKECKGAWYPCRFEKVHIKPPTPAPKPPSLPPEVKWMTLDCSTIFTLVQAHIKDMYNITQEISSIDTQSTPRGVILISFKEEDKNVTS